MRIARNPIVGLGCVGRWNIASGARAGWSAGAIGARMVCVRPRGWVPRARAAGLAIAAMSRAAWRGERDVRD